MKIIKRILTIIIGGFMLLVLIGIGSIANDNKSEATKKAAATVAANPPPAPVIEEEPSKEPSEEVTDKVLAAAYDDNPIGADARFRGKRISIIGRIHDIGREVLGSPYVSLADNVTCYFSKDQEEAVAKLRKGQRIIATGEVRGTILIGVYVKNCELTAIQAEAVNSRVARD